MARQRRSLSLSLFYIAAAAFLSLALLLLTRNGANPFSFSGDGVLPLPSTVLLPSQNSSKTKYLLNSRMVSHKPLLPASSSPSPPPHSFCVRATTFFAGSPPCRPRFFMTWIAKLDSFGERELLCVQSIFKFHPHACLLILSSSMDSSDGTRLLKPLTNHGFRAAAMAPDFAFLLEHTPAKLWFQSLMQGGLDPGAVPLGQNLSNLLRLAVLYRFGGVYVDADVIILREFTGLRNVIGAQTAGGAGNWSRLNNAVMVFEKHHPLVLEFMREFALTFDGSRWGHNGPYLVSRVAERVRGREGFEFAVAPPSAFYPVIWSRIGGCFRRPESGASERWVEEKLETVRRESFAVHLWNRRSRGMAVEEGSLIGRLFSSCCVLCNSSSQQMSQ